LRYPDEALLSIPLILSFFVLSGMRMVFAIPSELPANWTFQITEDSDHKDCLSGVRKAMMLLAIVPIFSLLFPVYAVLWGLGLALLRLHDGPARILDARRSCAVDYWAGDSGGRSGLDDGLSRADPGSRLWFPV
jgi:hypothetical protein